MRLLVKVIAATFLTLQGNTDNRNVIIFPLLFHHPTENRRAKQAGKPTKSRKKETALPSKSHFVKLEALRKPSTWEIYRRKLKVFNQNKLIVFANDYFGIFPLINKLASPDHLTS